ncbi:dephospho-CoA kinase [Myroides ceti]|uniref:Dephospho-CoA kinase n=1 Tax=Paenimyroides ceti TaxID=395087 RepID=A0ABT8CSM4_9FLAO|nr:dephospho-CoA kinase [Paenimyroides ceti]MDN3707503.1 dephospho-CoA kinase [Paenimyroides ceti]
MAIIVGLTGGIGSGKTTVMKHIETLGYKVYYADEAGKRIMEQPEMIRQVQNIFDEDVVDESGYLDRKRIASIVFNNPDKLTELNAVIHPAVARDFDKCIAELGKNEIVVKESAILFESGAYKNCDFTVLITAPEPVRIKRVVERDGISEEEVKNRINNQFSDAKKIKLSNFVVNNVDLTQTFFEIEMILKGILR